MENETPTPEPETTPLPDPNPLTLLEANSVLRTLRNGCLRVLEIAPDDEYQCNDQKTLTEFARRLLAAIDDQPTG